MIYPPIGELLEMTGTRYSLVIATSKRARQLGESGDENVDTYDKAIVEAIGELYDGTVSIRKYN